MAVSSSTSRATAQVRFGCNSRLSATKGINGKDGCMRKYYYMRFESENANGHNCQHWRVKLVWLWERLPKKINAEVDSLTAAGFSRIDLVSIERI